MKEICEEKSPKAKKKRQLEKESEGIAQKISKINKNSNQNNII